MDGSTKAAMHCMFLTSVEQQQLRPPGQGVLADWARLKRQNQQRNKEGVEDTTMPDDDEVEVGKSLHGGEENYFRQTGQVCARMKRRVSLKTVDTRTGQGWDKPLDISGVVEHMQPRESPE